MGGTPFTSQIFSARAEVLSSQLNRAEALGSKALQDVLEEMFADSTQTPIGGLLLKPSLAAIVATFHMTLGQGRGFVQSSTGVTTDDSDYQVLSWDSQTIAFTSPDPSNPRIDLVVATPASVATDPISQNVLTDPVARTVAPIVLNTTEKPVSTITVIAGTAASTPVPPAVPAGSLPLYEVRVPAAAVDATAFKQTSRAWRLAPYPFSTMNTVVRGVQIFWANTGTVPNLPTLSSVAGNQVILDGQLIEWSSSGSAAIAAGDGNAANNPFNIANAAPANNDQPFYLYLVGGLNSPQAGSTGDQPLALVASLVAPDLVTGKPSSAITPPRGSGTTSCVYVGIGYTVRGTANSRPCLISGDWICPFQNPVGDINKGFENLPDTNAGLSDLSIGGASGTAVTLASKPSVSTEVGLSGYLNPDTGTATGRQIGFHTAAGTGTNLGPPQITTATAAPGGAAAPGNVTGRMSLFPITPQIRVLNTSPAAADGFTNLFVTGYNMKTRRLDYGSGTVSA